jgi:hypothetical protein
MPVEDWVAAVEESMSQRCLDMTDTPNNFDSSPNDAFLIELPPWQCVPLGAVLVSRQVF